MAPYQNKISALTMYPPALPLPVAGPLILGLAK